MLREKEILGERALSPDESEIEGNWWKKYHASQLSCSVIDVALELHNPIEETHYANTHWEVTAKALSQLRVSGNT